MCYYVRNHKLKGENNMICRNCGSQNDEGTTFCNNCGAAIVVENGENGMEYAPFGEVAPVKKKPIYKKWWFYLLLVLLIGVIIVAAVAMIQAPFIEYNNEVLTGFVNRSDAISQNVSTALKAGNDADILKLLKEYNVVEEYRKLRDDVRAYKNDDDEINEVHQQFIICIDKRCSAMEKMYEAFEKSDINLAREASKENQEALDHMTNVVIPLRDKYCEKYGIEIVYNK